MTQYDDTNRGVMFKAKDGTYEGKLNIDGDEVKIKGAKAQRGDYTLIDIVTSDEREGVIFYREVEEGSKRPNWTGKFGDKQLAGWVKTPRAGGNPFLSLSISEPYNGGKTEEAKKEEPAAATSDSGYDEDIPF
jgi:hypothetical protein